VKLESKFCEFPLVSLPSGTAQTVSPSFQMLINITSVRFISPRSNGDGRTTEADAPHKAQVSRAVLAPGCLAEGKTFVDSSGG